MEEASGKVFPAPEQHIQEDTLLVPLNIFMSGREAWNNFIHNAARVKRAEAREPQNPNITHWGPALPLDFLLREIIHVFII